MKARQVMKWTMLLIAGLFLGTPAKGMPSPVDTGTMDCWDGNLPAKYIYKEVSAAILDVDTGTMDFVDETGLTAEYIFQTFRGVAPVVLGWYSVRGHTNGLGAISLELSTTRIDSEPRRGGVQQIKVQFSLAVKPVSGVLDTNDVFVTGAGNGPGSGPQMPRFLSLASGNTDLLIDFDEGDLPDNKVYTFDLADRFVGEDMGSAVEAGSSSLTCQVRSLAGDIAGHGLGKGDGVVDLIDVAAVKLLNRQPVTAANAWADLNGDGKINLIDAAFAKLAIGK